ncbi:hypothetical protein GFV15_02960 [Lactococcus lactis]|uniref:hypothetical protein n=1 Tax=Lactococcus lactis TaxID=1358 RepID=UPI001294088D|nr:hypothetical protein [Lactococcus lactis]MQQ79941.1 hypothetical protein [Lactococcus lactis]
MAQVFLYGNPHYFYKELNSVTKAIQEAMRWFAPLSYIMVTEEIEGEKYYHYDWYLLGKDDIFDYYLPTHDRNSDAYFTYFAHSKILWEINAKSLVQSFYNQVIPNAEKIKFGNLDSLITKWMKGDFVKIINSSEKLLRKNQLYAIGYQVYDLNRTVVEWVRQKNATSLMNYDLVDIEYRPMIWQNEELRYKLFKDTKTLTGDWDLSVYHNENPNEELTERHEKNHWNEEVIHDKIIKPNLYDGHYENIFEKHRNEGKYFNIPSLLSDQSYVANQIENASKLLYAQQLTNMQAKWLSVMDRDEFLSHFNIE